MIKYGPEVTSRLLRTQTACNELLWKLNQIGTMSGFVLSDLFSPKGPGMIDRKLTRIL